MIEDQGGIGPPFYRQFKVTCDRCKATKIVSIHEGMVMETGWLEVRPLTLKLEDLMHFCTGCARAVMKGIKDA